MASPLRPSNCGIYPGTQKGFAVGVFSIRFSYELASPSPILSDSNPDSIRETPARSSGRVRSTVSMSPRLLGAPISHLNIFFGPYSPLLFLGISVPPPKNHATRLLRKSGDPYANLTPLESMLTKKQEGGVH